MFAGYPLERHDELMYAGILAYTKEQRQERNQLRPRRSMRSAIDEWWREVQAAPAPPSRCRATNSGVKRRYEERKADGRCTKCTKPREQLDRSLCDKCLAYNRNRINARNERARTERAK